MRVGGVGIAGGVIAGRRVGDTARRSNAHGVGQVGRGGRVGLGGDGVGDGGAGRQVHRIAEIGAAGTVAITAAGAAA